MMKLEGILTRITVPRFLLHHHLQVGPMNFSSKGYVKKICLQKHIFGGNLDILQDICMHQEFGSETVGWLVV